MKYRFDRDMVKKIPVLEKRIKKLEESTQWVTSLANKTETDAQSLREVFRLLEVKLSEKMKDTVSRMNATEKALNDMRKYEIVEKLQKECDKV
jgi:hypothetical protein